jgi:nitrite reductase/ring-hydroxylating ferredoxin subunit
MSASGVAARTDLPRSAGLSYQDYLDTDSRPVPAALREQSQPDLGTAPLAAERYTSQAFFDLEAERMWPRVWQMACREEEVAHPGDAVVYDILGYSWIILRGRDGELRALANSCLHRGRRLLDADARSLEQLHCKFHGFRWGLEGQLQSIPCRWDFPQLTDEGLRLPEARIGTWGGFVFINMDPRAPSLEDYLGVLPAHFARWRLEDCWKSVHVAKVIPCNWKVAQEAFMESYHVIATHPQILPIIADANSQYDVFGEHVNRNLTAFAATSPHLARQGVSDAEVLQQMLALWRAPGVKMPEGAVSPRAALGELNRRSFARAFAGDFAQATDAEVLDALVYNVFPNFSPWGGFAPNIIYRWRPHGRRVDACVMEVMILKRLPKEGPRPVPVPVHWLGESESWSSATELPILGAVIDQDMDNMPQVQAGLEASRTGLVHLGRYQELRLRHFHRTLDRYLADTRT